MNMFLNTDRDIVHDALDRLLTDEQKREVAILKAQRHCPCRGHGSSCGTRAALYFSCCTT